MQLDDIDRSDRVQCLKTRRFFRVMVPVGEPLITESQYNPLGLARPLIRRENREAAVMALKILGVSGSLRAGSFSRRALEFDPGGGSRDPGPRRGCSIWASPNCRCSGPAETAIAEVVRAVAEVVTWADAFLLATPDYHGSMSGAMKNFLDYHWEEFAGKLFGYICASHEKGLTAMDQMRTAVRQCYGWSLPYGVSSTASTTSTQPEP